MCAVSSGESVAGSPVEALVQTLEDTEWLKLDSEAYRVPDDYDGPIADRPLFFKVPPTAFGAKQGPVPSTGHVSLISH